MAASVHFPLPVSPRDLEAGVLEAMRGKLLVWVGRRSAARCF